jgi:hypothetical protein
VDLSLIFTPNGGMINTERTDEDLPPEYLRMLVVLADTSAQLDIGLHCSRCNTDLVGSNNVNDPRMMLECACRTFTGPNPMRES